MTPRQQHILVRSALASGLALAVGLAGASLVSGPASDGLASTVDGRGGEATSAAAVASPPTADGPREFARATPGRDERPRVAYDDGRDNRDDEEDED